jgi:hypothetical protein
MDKSKETNSTCPVSYVESIPKKQKEWPEYKMGTVIFWEN